MPALMMDEGGHEVGKAAGGLWKLQRQGKDVLLEPLEGKPALLPLTLAQ